MKRFVKSLLFFLILSCPVFVLSVDIGSDTTVDRFENQQTLNEGDRIAGFAAIEGGFVLADSTVTATFDSFFPVSGEIDLNNGTLYLDRDLIFRDTSSIRLLGDIVSNGHSVEFSATITRAPLINGSNDAIFTDLQLFLHANTVLDDCSITFSGDSRINGRGNALTLGDTCTLIVASDSNLIIEDIIVDGISGTKIHCTDALSTISFKNVEWILDGDYSFTVGKFVVIKDFLICGDGFSFNYQTDQVSTVSDSARFILDNGVTFSYDPATSSKELFTLFWPTSEFIMNGATLHSTSTGMRLSTGRFVVDRASVISNEGLVKAEGINFASDLDIQWYPAANLDFSQGFVVFE